MASSATQASTPALAPITAAAAARVHNYEGVKNEAYYRALDVDGEGHLSVRPRLTKRHIEFLNSIRTSAQMWDGTLGFHGLPFESDPPTPTSPRSSGVDLPEARRICARLQADLHHQPDDENTVPVSIPSNTTSVNTELLLQQAPDSIPTDDESLAKEAKHLAETREDRRKRTDLFVHFQRPALIAATVYHMKHSPGSTMETYMKYYSSCGAYVLFRAKRKDYFDALKAYSDVCEALHVLHGVETSLERALRDKSVNELKQISHAIEADKYVAAALRTTRAVELTTWALAMSELPETVHGKKGSKKLKKKDAYTKRLTKIYKDVGKCYDAVKKWKAEVKNIVLQRKTADTKARHGLINCWKSMLDL